MKKSCLWLFVIGIVLTPFIVYFISNEIYDAFSVVEEGLIDSNNQLDSINEVLKRRIKLIPDENFTVSQVEGFSLGFNELIDSTIGALVSRSGGWKVKKSKIVVSNPKDNEIGTQILIVEGVGKRIFKKIKETEANYKEIIFEISNKELVDLPLKIDSTFIEMDGKTWEEFNFNKLPVLPTVAILRKFSNNEKKSKEIIYNLILNKGQ